jgi:predicted MPP superfamily phosphohydrolase
MGIFATALDQFGMTWMALLFLTSIPLLATDIITGFGFIFSKQAQTLRGYALIIGGVLCMIALIQGHRSPVIQDYEVHLSDLPPEMDGRVLVAMSDMHLGSLLGQAWLEARVKQVQDLRPDMVVLLGDIFEGHGQPRTEFLQTLNRITAPLGVWTVAGNHEFHSESGGTMTLVQEAGLNVLHNRWTVVRPGLVLAGIDDLTTWHRDGRVGDPVTQTLSARPPGATILLSHTPWEADEAARMGVELMLCGHTHSGQIWPFGYLVRLRYPLLAGRYDKNGMTVIVCRGTGTWGPRMRLWHPGEILRVTLHSGK